MFQVNPNKSRVEVVMKQPVRDPLERPSEADDPNKGQIVQAWILSISLMSNVNNLQSNTVV
jgi:hypothetical protein